MAFIKISSHPSLEFPKEFLKDKIIEKIKNILSLIRFQPSVPIILDDEKKWRTLTADETNQTKGLMFGCSWTNHDEDSKESKNIIVRLIINNPPYSSNTSISQITLMCRTISAYIEKFSGIETLMAMNTRMLNVRVFPKT